MKRKRSVNPVKFRCSNCGRRVNSYYGDVCHGDKCYNCGGKLEMVRTDGNALREWLRSEGVDI